MPLAPEARQAAAKQFINSLADVPWFSNAGKPHGAAIVPDDLVDAWDNWNSKMLAVWRPEINTLETLAIRELGEDGVSAVFEIVSREMDASLSEAIERYYLVHSIDTTNTDRGLWPEWLDSVKRDLCWAAIEAVLAQPGFFTEILAYYRAGRWPCAWEDADRNMRVVLL